MPKDPLRAAVLAAPDDDSVRQLYADALIQAGSPQGLFISHQLALAAMDPLDPSRTPLIAETKRLQAAYSEQWLVPLLQGLGDVQTRRQRVSSLRNAHFERGFLSRIAVTADDLALLQLLSTQTPLEGAQLLFTEYVPRASVDSSTWRWMKITPDGWFTAHAVAQVLCWGSQSLRTLDLSGCDLGESGAQLVVGQPTDLDQHFPEHVDPEPLPAGQLRHLILDRCNLHDAGLQVLLQSGEQLVGLQTLSLAQCRLTGSLKSLPDAPFAGSLTALSLAGNTIDVADLTGWERLSSLRTMGLPKNTTPAQFSALFTGSSALRELHLAGAKLLLADPAPVFAAAEHLTHLNLSTAGLKDAGFSELIAAPSTQSLDALKVNGCSLSDASIVALVESGLHHLFTLDISSNRLTDKALERLAGWSGIDHLLTLNIRNNRKITPAGYDALIQCQTFQPLHFDVGTIKDAPLLQRLEARFGKALNG